MFKIIGADGREYGPIAQEQLRQWIAEGRANAHTKVQVEGATGWQRLGELPEFADLWKTASAAAGPATAIAEGTAEIAEPAVPFRVGSCMSRGWDLVKANFWLSVGVTALIVVLVWAASFIPIVGPFLLNYVLLGGLDWFYLKLVRNQKAEVADSFVGFGPMFVPLMLFSLVSQLAATVGFILCILPGVYLTVIWLLFPALLILDKGMDWWPAMELSRKVCQRHFWRLLGLVLLTTLLILGGLLVFVVGMFITLPIAIAAIVYAYEDLFGTRSVTTHAPPEAGSNPATNENL